MVQRSIPAIDSPLLLEAILAMANCRGCGHNTFKRLLLISYQDTGTMKVYWAVPRGQLFAVSRRVYCCSMLKYGWLASAWCITAAQGALLLVGWGLSS